MSKVKTSLEMGNFTISIQHSAFDLSLQDEFFNAYKTLDFVPDRFIIDFRKVKFIDSSGVSVLLDLSNHAKDAGGVEVNIINCNPHALKILKITRLDEIIKVS